MLKRISILFTVIALAVPAYAQNTTTGAIHGQVRELNDNSTISGVTVIAKSGQGSSSPVITGSNGRYRITSLIPGKYELTYFYMDKIVARKTNVTVSINRTYPVYIKLDTSKLDGDVVTIEGSPPQIDTKSAALTTTLDQDYVQNMPVPGRTFEDTLGAAPGTSGDGLGVAFSGSSSLENQYNVDGVNTTSLTFGTVGSPIINDFIQEIEIITGGYQAEYGRATGGIANVVTKSGSNEFKGSAWINVRPGALIAQQEQFESQVSPINIESNVLFAGDMGFELGGPIIKDKLFFFLGFAPQLSVTDVDRIIKRRTDCRTPGQELCTPGGGDGFEDVKENGDYILEEVDRTQQQAKGMAFSMLGKLNFSLTPEHQGQASVVVQPGSSTGVGVFGLVDSEKRESKGLNTNASFKWTSKFNNNDTEVEFQAGMFRNSFESFAANSAKNTEASQTAYDANLGIWSALGGETARVAAGCTDANGVATADNPYPLISVCPDEGIVGYRFGGIGALADDLEARISGKISLTQRLRLGKFGNHEIKAGADVERNNARSVRRLSGNAAYQIFANFTQVDQWGALGPAVEGPNPGDSNGDGIPDLMQNASGARVWDRVCSDTGSGRLHPCDIIGQNDPRGDVNGETMNWSAYLRDSWEIVPNLTLNAGIRYEEQRLRFSENLRNTTDPLTGNELGKNAMVLKDMWAPRIGLIWDWSKVGKSKLFANWGRFYESIPMQINDRSFGGETFVREVFTHDNCGAADPAVGGPRGPACMFQGGEPTYDADGRPTNIIDTDLDGIPDNLAQGQVFGSGVLIAPGIQAQFMDEFVMGFEYELLEDLKISLKYQNRRIGRVLEDVSTDNATTYVLANPGEWSKDEENKIDGQIEDLTTQIDAESDPDRLAELVGERARLRGQLDLFRGIRTFDTPRRDYNAIELLVQKRFSRQFFLQASYTYSRLIGNYPGLFSPDNGQVDPNISSQFDLIELLSNREGPLPNDRPHYIKIDGYYKWDFGKFGELTTGGRYRALSGTPRDALGRHYRYGFNEAFLVGRGELGRVSFDMSLDVHVGYKYKLGRGMELEIFGDVFNVSNRQSTAAVSETYTTSFANPIVGGNTEDLVFLKEVDDNGLEPAATRPNAASRFQNFGNTTGRYGPLSVRLGARLTF